MSPRIHASYFGPFSVQLDRGAVVHNLVGSENLGGTGQDPKRFCELSETHLTLSLPIQADSEGRTVQTALR